MEEGGESALRPTQRKLSSPVPTPLRPADQRVALMPVPWPIYYRVRFISASVFQTGAGSAFRLRSTSVLC
ncbi:hypothetical protein ABZP36_024626 [Zizania latifolia]